MIATILPGSAGFYAVDYNERKVAKGCARLLEMKNFGDVGIYEPYTMAELTQYLLDWSFKNNRVTKPQIHIAISCKGHEMTEWEQLDFAHEYLKEMGYGEEGQPLLVYSHYDNANTHIHIITSQVGPDGKKINHNHERRRTQAVIDKILKVDRLGKVGRDGNITYAISFTGKRIVNLTAEGFDLSKPTWRSDRKKKHQEITVQPKSQQSVRSQHLKPLRDVGGGSQGDKRQWEVSHRGNYDEIDDERSLKLCF